MRKKIIIILLILLPIGGIFGKNSSSKSPIGLDLGVYLAWGIFDSSEVSSYYPMYGFIQTFLSVKGGITGSLRYRLTKDLSAGASVGTTFLSFNSGHVDIPINTIFRWGAEDVFLEASLGYYFASDSSLDGMSIGLKGSYDRIFLGGAYIWGKDMNYTRFTLGYQWNNIF